MSTVIRPFALLVLAFSIAAGAGCAGVKPPASRNDAGTGGSGGTVDAGIDRYVIDSQILSDAILQTCGNRALDPTEGCDDGNTANDDGCNAICQIEADYLCPNPGQPCEYQARCGDSKLSSTEACDDGNETDGDGCSRDCTTVTPGWQCRVPGRRCVPLCGDTVLTGTENCDDGNTNNLDGCSSTCLTEPGWSCNGSVCIQSVCGNGTIEAGEACDNGEALNGLFYGDGTGCSKTCTAEPTCRNGATTGACSTHCGDANKDVGEDCDDGNAVSGDGCSETCLFEDGFTCTDSEHKDTTPCIGGSCLLLPITYRDFNGQNVAGGHPDFFYMGATPSGGTKTVCVPNAAGRAVTANGTCWSNDSTPLCTGLVSSTLGADGKPALNTARTGGPVCACRFTDWDGTGALTGAAGVTTCTDSGGYPRTRIETNTRVIQSAATLAQWYSDSTASTKVLGTLELLQVAGTTNQYRFSSSNGRTVYDDLHEIFLGNLGVAGGVTFLSSGFFPLDGETGTGSSKLCNIWPYWFAALHTATGCRAIAGNPVTQQWDPRGWYGTSITPPATITGGPVTPVTGTLRNFYFTSEVRYLFRYVGGETLEFYGDDDVWVFINGKLVLDLGAPHERLLGSVTLNAAGGATWVISATDVVTLLPTTIATGTVANLGLQEGNTYEIAIFHADRHPRESNYQLTVSGFSTTKTSCIPRCGDAIVAAGEECDDGDGVNNDTAYGGCTTQCKFGPFCGDGITNVPDEQCDNGRDNGQGYGEEGCTASCRLPHFCGDGIPDTAYGEQCDQGRDVNGTPGAFCNAECRIIIG